MTDCTNSETRDALPDLLNGRLSELDTATMTAHVESCPACREELELLREVRRSAPLAPSIDAARIVAALPAYPGTMPAPERDQRRASGFFSRIVAWKVVAAMAVIAIAGWGIGDLSRDRDVQTLASAPQPARVAVSPQPTTTNDAGTGAPAVIAQTGLSLVAGVQELTDDDIEVLLAELDGLEAVPSVDPEALTLSPDELADSL